jgi:AcrR family transcriptional regulator
MNKRPSKAKTKGALRLKKNPTSYHHGDLRQALIETGLLVIREQGAHALSLREAARKAGVSEAAPYRHFTNKESLLAAIAEEGFKRLHSRLSEAATESQDEPLVQLQSLAWRYVEFALDDTDLFRAMFSSSLVPPHAEKHPTLSQAAIGTFEQVVQVVVACQGSGHIQKAANPKIIATHLWGSIHGMTVLLVDQQMSFLGVTIEQARSIIRAQLDSHLEGLKTFKGS